LRKKPENKNYTIALAGQPNVGKSSVFNLLTGMNQHVGNWTGKTVECKSGTFTFKGKKFSVVDLPGTYSLTACSEEERIARNFIIKEKPDLIVAIVNAASLERSLYLVAELLLLDSPVIILLNMTDVAQSEGIQVQPKVLEAALGAPVVPMVATKGIGAEVLKETILRCLNEDCPYQPQKPYIRTPHEPVFIKLKSAIHHFLPQEYQEDWVAIKLLEGDEEIIELMKNGMPQAKWKKVQELLYRHEDAILDIAGARYEWVARQIRAAVIEPKITRMGMTAQLDRVLTHPVLGTLILIAILGVVFWLTFSLGGPIQQQLSVWLGQFGETIRTSWVSAPAWVVEFIASGILGGIGMVLTFLPILFIFFAILAIMEDSGYMARAAFLSDRWMHMIGLHGKSLMPILLGFGCNVPAIMGTRIIESNRARLLTILLIPLVPCTARLAVVTILASVFFGANAFWISWALVGGSLVILAGLGFILHHFFFANEHVPFIMELPLYHSPNLRTIALYIRDNLSGFIKKAGTIILAASLVVWILSYFPSGSIMTSYLAGIGKALEPIGRWMGLPWPVMVALLSSFVAKENTIAILGILYKDINSLSTILSPAAALAFLVFQILFIPCVGTVAAIYQETHSWKWTSASILLQLTLSLGFSVAVFQIGSVL
jgi:ferrous iron transport protein B